MKKPLKLKAEEKMINLKLYDTIVDVHKTWISPRYKNLYSKVIKYKPFYTILKRYNALDRCNDFYLVISENLASGYRWFSTIKNSSYIKLDLTPFWKEINKFTTKEDIEINIELDDKDEETEIYRLDM